MAALHHNKYILEKILNLISKMRFVMRLQSFISIFAFMKCVKVKFIHAICKSNQVFSHKFGILWSASMHDCH